MRAIILAAGRGKRLEHFNPDGRPKCLLEIGGRSLLDRLLQLLKHRKVESVDLVVGYQAERIIEHVEKLADSCHWAERHGGPKGLCRLQGRHALQR